MCRWTNNTKSEADIKRCLRKWVSVSVMKGNTGFGYTVILEIGLTDTLLITLWWPPCQGLSADQPLRGLRSIKGRRKMYICMVPYLATRHYTMCTWLQWNSVKSRSGSPQSFRGRYSRWLYFPSRPAHHACPLPVITQESCFFGLGKKIPTNDTVGELLSRHGSCRLQANNSLFGYWWRWTQLIITDKSVLTVGPEIWDPVLSFATRRSTNANLISETIHHNMHQHLATHPPPHLI